MADSKNPTGLHISYNAPVTLTFSIATVIIFILEQFVFKGMVGFFFTAPGRIGSDMFFSWENPLDYIRIISHVFGHMTWEHLLGNISYILILGPLLEERYGSKMLVLMMTTTAIVTGVLNACFIPRSMVGASGIAFMMILLSSFTAISRHQIPLTFILVLVLFIGQEVFISWKNSDIAALAHITGGICGSLFGFLHAHKPVKTNTSQRIIQESNTLL